MALPLIPLLVGAAGSFLGKKLAGGGSGGSAPSSSQPLNIPPEIRALIEMQQRIRQRQQLLTDPGAADMFGMTPPEGAVPLQGAIAQLAYSLLPDSAKSGLSVPGQASDPGRLPSMPAGGDRALGPVRQRTPWEY